MADKNELRVGQEIAILTSGFRSGFSLNKEPYRIDKITYVGKIQIKTADGSRWMIDSRRKIGSPGIHSERLAFDGEKFALTDVETAKEENARWREENEIRIMRRKISYIQWGERYIDDDKIKRVHAFLKAEGIV